MNEEALRKAHWEKIAGWGGRVNSGLPLIGDTPPRSSTEIADRWLVLVGLYQLALDAPVEAVRAWIAAEGLESALSPAEARLLAKSDDERTRQEDIDLSWSVETIYALMWVGGLLNDLSPEGSLPDGIARLSPDIEFGESGAKFRDRMAVRPYEETFAMRDLFYAAHWSAREARREGERDGPLSEETIGERRKALEWALDRTMDWDEVDQDT